VVYIVREKNVRNIVKCTHRPNAASLTRCLIQEGG